jgi:hypothetical protein
MVRNEEGAYAKTEGKTSILMEIFILKMLFRINSCPKEVWRKRHPTIPALRAPLLGGTEWGTACMRIPDQVGDIRMIKRIIVC